MPNLQIFQYFTNFRFRSHFLLRLKTELLYKIHGGIACLSTSLYIFFFFFFPFLFPVLYSSFPLFFTLCLFVFISLSLPFPLCLFTLFSFFLSFFLSLTVLSQTLTPVSTNLFFIVHFLFSRHTALSFFTQALWCFLWFMSIFFSF